jgi:uncharacterized protein YbjT (DUF2867 family)
VLRECLLDPGVQLVQAIGRTSTGVQHAKLRELVHRDSWHYADVEADLSGFDACFFCLGMTSSGMTEDAYTRVTYDITMAAADTLCRLNTQMTFIYVSGAGTDSSEQGRTMWARVKGRTENALLQLPFAGVYMFRPGVIEPRHGARSKTASYRILYTLTQPLLPVLRWVFPNYVLTTEQIGRAMLAVAAHGFPKRVLESRDIRSAIRP